MQVKNYTFNALLGTAAKNVLTTLLAKCLKATVMSLCFKDAIFITLLNFRLIAGLPTVQKCTHLLQVFPLNLMAFYFSFHDSVAMLLKMEFAHSSSDISDIISDISVSSAHTLRLLDCEQSISDYKYEVEERRAGTSSDTRGQCNKTTALKGERFAEETGANATTDGHSQLALLFHLFEEETVQTTAKQMNEYARLKSELLTDLTWVDNNVTGRTDHIYKIRPLIDMANRKEQASKNNSIDEATVSFKGRSRLRHCLPAKPTTWG